MSDSTINLPGWIGDTIAMAMVRRVGDYPTADEYGDAAAGEVMAIFDRVRGNRPIGFEMTAADAILLVEGTLRRALELIDDSGLAKVRIAE